MARPLGITLYDGPSALDGAPIVVVATFNSNNRKTGAMVQVWILRKDVSPVAAIQSGADASICGDCVHRSNVDGVRTCYVNVGQAPLAVWNAYRRGKYPTGTVADIPRGRPVRLGAYGDPAAVPFDVFAGVDNRKVWTGYSHQWRTCDQRYRSLLMASADSVADAADAAAMGWRSFLVTPDGAPIPEQMIECPSETHGVQCATCGLCKGAAIGAPSIAIGAHGPAKRFVGSA